jgi:regulatory protein
MRTELVKTARQRMAGLCSRREYCRADILKKLEPLGLEGEECARVLDDLQAEGYIDEARYARSFVNDRFRLHQWGRRKIRYELVGRGIAESLADAALAGIGEEEYREVIRKLAGRKLAQLPAADAWVLRNKLVQHLVQKGFEPEIAQSAAADLVAAKGRQA